jgi:hypothetical protein
MVTHKIKLEDTSDKQKPTGDTRDILPFYLDFGHDVDIERKLCVIRGDEDGLVYRICLGFFWRLVVPPSSAGWRRRARRAEAGGGGGGNGGGCACRRQRPAIISTREVSKDRSALDLVIVGNRGGGVGCCCFCLEQKRERCPRAVSALALESRRWRPTAALLRVSALQRVFWW